MIIPGVIAEKPKSKQNLNDRIMKKKLGILTLMLLIIGSIKAQEQTTAVNQTTGPTGKVTVEINFDPAAIFDANAGAMFYMPYIKARYFLQPSLALRLGLGIGYGSNTNYTDVTDDDYSRTTEFEINFAPGIEKHLGSKKFFAYFGAAIPITSYSYNLKEEIDGETYDTKNPYGLSYFGIGLDLIAGVDFYILNNFYIGAEISPGFVYQSYKDSENADGDIIDKGSKWIDFGLAASSGIRIGVRF
jgi:hypothetical protein